MSAFNKDVAKVTGDRVNRGAGYGPEVPCIYRSYGPKTYLDKVREVLRDLHVNYVSSVVAGYQERQYSGKSIHCVHNIVITPD